MIETIDERDVMEVERKSGSKTLDIRDLYKFEPEDLVLDISANHYSNLAYIQVAPRDVIIDFLGLPGVKKDGKMVIGGVRVFMSHVAAQKLAESLSMLLENSYKNGIMEKFDSQEPGGVELTTKITRTSEEGKT